MWCRICGQDVPGIPALGGEVYSCARCGAPVASALPQSVAVPQSASTSQGDAAEAGTAAQQPPIYDAWEIDEELRHIRRALGRAPVPRDDVDEPWAQPMFRLDADHDMPAPHGKQARRSSRSTARAAAENERAPGHRPLAVLAWITLLLGTAGSVSGLALMGWSLHVERPDLWAVGTPTILAGQIVLILGLVLHLNRGWRDSPSRQEGPTGRVQQRTWRSHRR